MFERVTIPADVDAFWQAGVDAGHRDDDRVVGRIDHLWIRVADVPAARAVYLERLRDTGFALGTDTPERVQFRGPRSSFSLVAGEPTEHFHMTVRGDDGSVVEVV